jgi:hypothetical protein
VELRVPVEDAVEMGVVDHLEHALAHAALEALLVEHLPCMTPECKQTSLEVEFSNMHARGLVHVEYEPLATARSRG